MSITWNKFNKMKYDLEEKRYLNILTQIERFFFKMLLLIKISEKEGFLFLSLE